MSVQFDGLVSLVTGGSRGIGRAVVLDLASRGAKVVFTFAKDESAAQETERLVADIGGSATGVRCDSTDSGRVDEVVSGLTEKHDRLDHLVCNAGVTRDQYLMLMTEEDFTHVIDTNLVGAFRFAKAVCRPMMARKTGSIVTISSVAAETGIAGQTNYCASKGGLVAMTRAMSAELSPKGVRVNAVLPGFIDTEMTAKMPRQVKRDSLDRILLKRFGAADEVAKVVSFLLSQDASYIVGQAIVVDGGLTAAVG